MLGGTTAVAVIATACSSTDSVDLDPNDPFDTDGLSSNADPIDTDPNDPSDADI